MSVLTQAITALLSPETRAGDLRATGPKATGTQAARALLRPEHVALLLKPVPNFVANRARTAALRLTGASIGRGTLFFGVPTMVGTGNFAPRLSVGTGCGFNRGCFFELDDAIRIEEEVAVGHDVMFLTGQRGASAAGAAGSTRGPIVIGAGTWLGARCTILPGVTVGPGSVIAASVVVSKDVPPDTLVTGSSRVSIAKWR